MASPTLPNPNDRRRRRRLRLIPIIGYTILALAAGYFLGERQSTTVIFVRHADTDATMAGPDDNPPLNARGRDRAAAQCTCRDRQSPRHQRFHGSHEAPSWRRDRADRLALEYDPAAHRRAARQQEFEAV